MKKLLMGVVVLAGINTTRAMEDQLPKIKIDSVDILEKRFSKITKGKCFEPGLTIMKRVANQEMDVTTIGSITYDEFKKFLGDDYSSCAVSLMSTFGFTQSIFEAIGVPEDEIKNAIDAFAWNIQDNGEEA